MDISTSHECNLLSLKLIAEYYDADYAELQDYYQELASDSFFLEALKQRIAACQLLYDKGLFSNDHIDSIDWFGNQRIALYVLVRLLKPKECVETGVFYGGTTAFILAAIEKNAFGRLISIDLPGNILIEEATQRHEYVGNSEIIPEGLSTGFIIPEYLKRHWQIIEGDSLQALHSIEDGFTFFSHDSEHSRDFVLKELAVADEKMPPGSTFFVDDIGWSNGFFEFCVRNRYYPLFLTDNGKDGLKVRLGVIQTDHPNCGKADVTG